MQIYIVLRSSSGCTVDWAKMVLFYFSVQYVRSSPHRCTGPIQNQSFSLVLGKFPPTSYYYTVSQNVYFMSCLILELVQKVASLAERPIS